ncbi:MAG: hypothetical protein QM760_19320 [Nibricoccus sp.]
MLANGFNRQADEAVDRGTVSVALAKALSVRGGIVYSIVFRPNARYATQGDGVPGRPTQPAARTRRSAAASSWRYGAGRGLPEGEPGRGPDGPRGG